MYNIDPLNGDIVINGFEKGIGDSPYSGLTDLKSINPSSIPGEASVSFATELVSAAPILTNYTGATLSTVSSGLVYFPTSQNIENNQYITFSSIGTATGSLAINTPYRLLYNGTVGSTQGYQMFTTSGVPITVTGSSASSTLSTINVGIINFMQKSISYNFAVDNLGRVWSDKNLTTTAGVVTTTNSWTWMGNNTDVSSNGNGLLLFTTVTNGTGASGASPSPTTVDEWLFVWRNSQIDYTKISSAGTPATITWVYGWNYALTSGTTTGLSNYLNIPSTTVAPHHALVTPDARANFCDGNYIGNWFQNVPSPGSSYVGFDPTNAATWTPTTLTAILPASEVGQCLAFVNQYLLIGTKSNIIYPWNLILTDNTYSTPLIQLPESNTSCIVAVGNNAYIFAGNRGNIYITNGSQASFFYKIPDHISGTVEPLVQWGNGANVGAGKSVTIGVSPQCAVFNKNRLYFGFSAIAQGTSVNIIGYGGIWCIDLNLTMLYNAQQMSYGNYKGYVSCLMVQVDSQNLNRGSKNGYGIVAAWVDLDDSIYGIDMNMSYPYTNGASYVTSELIPLGTALKPMTPEALEFKLSKPLVSGESVELLVGSYLDPSYASFISAGVFAYSSNANNTNFSGNTQSFPVVAYGTTQGQQWVVIQAKLTSVMFPSTPSYVRLTEIRIKAGASKDSIPTQPFSIQ
jgi:hypothetical protein